jgi:probable F420-dependent oxidoreductase
MGYDGLWLTDHVIGVAAYHPVYGGNWLEILSTLAYLAGVTKKVRLGTGVLVLPYRNPVLTAKIISTIDVLSGGRVDLGIGTGWSRAEFGALGVAAFHEPRGAVTDETIDVMLKCWQGGQVDWQSERFPVRKIEYSPVPLQRLAGAPRVPLWIGARGLGKAPMRRAAKYADVWHPTGLTPADFRTGGEQLDTMAGRKIPRSIRRNWPEGTSVSAILDELAQYREAGCFAAAVDFKTRDYNVYRGMAEQLIAGAGLLRT